MLLLNSTSEQPVLLALLIVAGLLALAVALSDLVLSRVMAETAAEFVFTAPLVTSAINELVAVDEPAPGSSRSYTTFCTLFGHHWPSLALAAYCTREFCFSAC